MAKRPPPSPAPSDYAPRAPRKAGRPTSVKPPRPRAAKAEAAAASAAATEADASRQPEPAPQPAPEPSSSDTATPDPFAMPGADQRQMLETLSMNLAKAAMTAQAAMAEAALAQAERPVAMGYVATAFAEPGTRVQAIVRGKPVPMEVSTLPFVPTRYYRG